MATFGEIAHAIQDFSKTISDDSVITIDHIIFLLGKYRNVLLLKSDQPLSHASYQTICIDLSSGSGNDFCGAQPYLVSDAKVPDLLGAGSIHIAPPAGFLYGYRFQYVSPQKFQFVGHNKWLRNLIYATIGPDSRLYLRGADNGFTYLSKLRLTALFDDIEKAAEQQCDECCDTTICDIEDRQFPMDNSLLPALMQAVTKEITAAAWQPRDDSNDASDDLATFAQILNRYTNNAFKSQVRYNQSQENKKQQQQ